MLVMKGAEAPNNEGVHQAGGGEVAPELRLFVVLAGTIHPAAVPSRVILELRVTTAPATELTDLGGQGSATPSTWPPPTPSVKAWVVDVDEAALPLEATGFRLQPQAVREGVLRSTGGEVSPFPPEVVVTDMFGPTVVFIIVTDTSVSTDTSKPSIEDTDVDVPEWPENDASFDYRMRGTAGAPS